MALNPGMGRFYLEITKIHRCNLFFNISSTPRNGRMIPTDFHSQGEPPASWVGKDSKDLQGQLHHWCLTSQGAYSKIGVFSGVACSFLGCMVRPVQESGGLGSGDPSWWETLVVWGKQPPTLSFAVGGYKLLDQALRPMVNMNWFFSSFGVNQMVPGVLSTLE